MAQQASDQWALGVLSRIRELKEFSDLTIVCEEVKYEVHKAIVCSQSPVLHAACTGDFQEAKSGVYEILDESSTIVGRFVQYLYTGDYTYMLEKDRQHIPPLQLHARIFALADKYDVTNLCKLAAEKYHHKLETDFDFVEFLNSIPDVYQLSRPESIMRTSAIHFARKRIQDTVHDSSNANIYDKITSEVPAFTKELLDSYIASPILSDCETCGPVQSMRVLQVRCQKCGRMPHYDRGLTGLFSS